MRGPWCISEEDAKARDARVLREFEGVAERCVHPDMPLDHVRVVLAARGYGAREARLLFRLRVIHAQNRT